jgi:hypothetical protein
MGDRWQTDARLRQAGIVAPRTNRRRNSPNGLFAIGAGAPARLSSPAKLTG